LVNNTTTSKGTRNSRASVSVFGRFMREYLRASA
jgi:hypothetical protein